MVYTMENRRSYEMLLDAQFHNHETILYYLTQISIYDDMLAKEAQKQTPDCGAIEYVTIQKDRLVKKLDALSKEIAKTQMLIEDLASDFLDGFTHPLYQKLTTIRQHVYEEFHKLLADEDLKCPDIIKNLSSYKERLELDEKIKQVPKEKRQVFFIRI